MTVKDYNKLINEASGFRGAYPLSVPLQVGDYCQLRKDGVPIHLGNVFNWTGWPEAAPIETIQWEGTGETLYAACSREMGPSAGGGVEVPGMVGVKGTLSLTFSKSGGFVLGCGPGTLSRFRDLHAVRQAILQAAAANRWQEDWILITEATNCASVTLLISTSKGWGIDLHANADIPASVIGGVAVASPKLGWTAVIRKGEGYTAVCQPGTPLYHCLKLDRSFLVGNWRSELLGKPADPFTDDPYADPT